MATTLNITSTYSGEASSDYIAASLLSGNTIANGLIEVKPNIKFKEVLRLIALDGITANASCDFADTSTVSLTERIIEPKQLQVNLEVCSHPFRSDWDAVSMGYSSHDTVPKNFSDYFIGLMAAKVSQKTEQDIWSGTAGAGSFDGFTTLLAADAGHTGATKITGEAVTPANVVTNLGLIVDAIPATLYGNDDLFIYVSQNIFRAYKRSLGGFQANGQGANGYMAQGNNQDIDVQFFDGVKVVACNGLADNKAIAALKSNLVFGCSLLSDFNECKVLDMSDLDGSSNVRFIMKYAAAVQYKLVGEIVSFGLGL
jgi:hypothetical protein